MDEKKQIEEMAKADLIEVIKKVPYGVSVGAKFEQHFCEKVANHIYNAGYRKQSEGEWEIVKGSNGQEKMVCTNCRHGQDLHSTFTYCPNCGARMHGAKMKGGAE